MSNQAVFKNSFLGVYETNPEHDYAKEVPFRVAILVPASELSGENPEGDDVWINCGYFKTEAAAARAYNMYAIKYLGKDAILNLIGTPTKAVNDEFNDFLSQKPHRSRTYTLSVAKANKLIKEYGNFVTYSGKPVAATNKVQVVGVL